MVFYRTYRPQTLSELDKEDVRKRLTVLLSQKDIPHALLFTGPKGTGKTSAARIVAKILNCTRSKDQKIKGSKDQNNVVEPCNICDSCRAITKGFFVDVIEIDAASNRGIDEIRELRDKIAYLPTIGKKKVYIIDEVHMLTREAFNALLKTLEEPPPHVVFILATTEAHKLPDTIVSRCIGVKFSKATSQELVTSFKRIASREKLKISEETLEEIAKHADGSFRDGVKLFEQVVSEGSGGESAKIFKEQAVTSRTVAIELISLCIKGDKKTAINQIEQYTKDGGDLADLISQMLSETHAQLLSHFSENSQKEAHKSVGTPEQLKELSKLLLRAFQETKTSVIDQLPLELSVIEYGKSGKSE